MWWREQPAHVQSVGTVGRREPDPRRDLRGDAPFGVHDEPSNFERKTKVGEYK